MALPQTQAQVDEFSDGLRKALDSGDEITLLPLSPPPEIFNDMWRLKQEIADMFLIPGLGRKGADE